MKKIISFLTAVSMLVLLASCEKKNSEKTIESHENSAESELLKSYDDPTEQTEDSYKTTSEKVSGSSSLSESKSSDDNSSETTAAKPKKAPVEQQVINEYEIDTYQMDIQTEKENTLVNVAEYDAAGFQDIIESILPESEEYLKQTYVRSIACDSENIYVLYNWYIPIEWYDDEKDMTFHSTEKDRILIVEYKLESGETRLITDIENKEIEGMELYCISDKLLLTTYNSDTMHNNIYEIDKSTGKERELSEINDGFCYISYVNGSKISSYSYNDDFTKIVNCVYDVDTFETHENVLDDIDGKMMYSYGFSDGSIGKAIINMKENTVYLECDEYRTELNIAGASSVYMTQESATIISMEDSGKYVYSYDFSTMECIKMKINGYGEDFIPVGKNLIGMPASSNLSYAASAFYIVPELGRGFKICESNSFYYRNTIEDYLPVIRMPVVTYVNGEEVIKDDTEKIYVIDTRGLGK